MMGRGFSRRRMLAGALAGGAGAIGASAASAGRRGGSSSAGRARRVILAVSDGMSTGTLSLADLYCRTSLGRSSAWYRLMGTEGARRAVCSTRSSDSVVTDSAAAASAWSIGMKVPNGSISIDTAQTVHEPILMTAKRAGYGTGLVTTTRVTHATPAAFIANVPRRSMEGIIAEQMMERGVDVILGGGGEYFPNELVAATDARLVRSRTELRALERSGAGGRWLGLFATSHLPFVLDREPDVPSLPEMSRAALARLDQSDDGFLLQVEGGRVDHAAHANDGASLLREQLEFDDTVNALMEYTLQRDDTLLIVTTDHGNANPGITLYGPIGERGLGLLGDASRSFAWLERQVAGLGDPASKPQELRRLIERATTVMLEDDEIAVLVRSMSDRVDPFGAANGMTSVLGSLLANHSGFAFLSPNHTADDVELTAIGPGSERIGHRIDNAELRDVMLGALGVV